MKILGEDRGTGGRDVMRVPNCDCLFVTHCKIRCGVSPLSMPGLVSLTVGPVRQHLCFTWWSLPDRCCCPSDQSSAFGQEYDEKDTLVAALPLSWSKSFAAPRCLLHGSLEWVRHRCLGLLSRGCKIFSRAPSCFLFFY